MQADEDVITYDDAASDEGFSEMLRLHLQRLITYAQSADPELQRDVAEKLANEAVKPERQVQIVELDGLQVRTSPVGLLRGRTPSFAVDSPCTAFPCFLSPTRSSDASSIRSLPRSLPFFP